MPIAKFIQGIKAQTLSEQGCDAMCTMVRQRTSLSPNTRGSFIVPLMLPQVSGSSVASILFRTSMPATTDPSNGWRDFMEWSRVISKAILAGTECLIAWDKASRQRFVYSHLSEEQDSFNRQLRHSLIMASCTAGSYPAAACWEAKCCIYGEQRTSVIRTIAITDWEGGCN